VNHDDRRPLAHRHSFGDELCTIDVDEQANVTDGDEHDARA
jgi:hypothetical protein